MCGLLHFSNKVIYVIYDSKNSIACTENVYILQIEWCKRALSLLYKLINRKLLKLQVVEILSKVF
jgi:hypothetical protein